ncbi:MAG: hypothetical protein NZ749_14020, partial [bacterium]|nr:hypothetical protein [bacterium]
MKHDAFCLDAVRFSKRRSLVVLVVSVHLGLFALSSAVGQSLTWLGTLGGNESQAYGISADSRVVVGTAQDASNVRRGFRWTRETGMQNLGNGTTAAHGVSADGSVVVGWHLDSLGRRFAFLWNLQHGARWLNIGGFSQTWANAVSADGAVVHGSAIFDSSNFPARWRSPHWGIEYMSGVTGTTWATS